MHQGILRVLHLIVYKNRCNWVLSRLFRAIENLPINLSMDATRKVFQTTVGIYIDLMPNTIESKVTDTRFLIFAEHNLVCFEDCWFNANVDIFVILIGYDNIDSRRTWFDIPKSRLSLPDWPIPWTRVDQWSTNHDIKIWLIEINRWMSPFPFGCLFWWSV